MDNKEDNEINDSLDRNVNSNESIKNEKHNKAFSVFMLILLIAVLIGAYFIYKGEYIEKDGDNSDNSSSSLFDIFKDDDEESEEDYDDEESDIYTSPFEDDDEWYDSEVKYAEEYQKFYTEYSKNIELVKSGKDSDGALYIVLKNNNDVTLTNVSIGIIFKDAVGTATEIEEEYLQYMASGVEYCIKVRNYNKYVPYEKFDLVYKCTYIDHDLESHDNDITFNVEEISNVIEKLKITYTNNSDVDIDNITFEILGLDDEGNIQSINYEYCDTLEKGQTSETELLRPQVYDNNTGNWNNLKYEVHLVEAYNINDIEE